MSVHHEVRGQGRRLVLAHGFTQNSRCWGPFGAELACDHEVVTVDLPGHGRTAPEHDEADLPMAATLLGGAGGRAVYVGYSMGGRVALHLALARPDLVDGLVLVGATAGIDDVEGRADRRRADGVLADRLLEVGLPAFLDRWLANPLFAGLGSEAAALSARLENRPAGLAASLRCCGTGTQQPLWTGLAGLDRPVLVLVGSRDQKFLALGRRMVGALPRAELVSIEGTHAVHLERPGEAAGVVRSFVASLDP